jgi:hypothetical protein
MMVDYHDTGNIGHTYGEGTGGFNTRHFDIDGNMKDGKLVGLKSRAKAQKPTIDYSISGEKICEFDAATYKGPGFDRDKVAKTLGGEGSIAVQVHGGGGWPKDAKCRWRNIRIKVL